MSIKIFNTFDKHEDQRRKVGGKKTRANSKNKKKQKAAKAPRKRLSASEIREKVEKGLGKKAGSMNKAKEVKGAQVSQFMSEVKTPFLRPPGAPVHDENSPVPEMAKAKAEGANEAKEVKGDLGLNDPNDTNTQEKLKDLLSSGRFDFGESGKVLSQILAGG